MDNGSKRRRILPKILIAVLAVLGGLFLLIMLLPMEDEESEDAYKGAASADFEQSARIEEVESGAIKTEADRASNEREMVSVGTDAKSATIMVYINGSDLESEAGEATTDISEMIASGIGDHVNVVLQTMGTRQWQDYGISSETAQTYIIRNGDLALVRDNLGQLDCTSEATLSEFINYSKTNFPADRYLLLFWDHGGGPVYGFGYDEWQREDASMNVSEIAEALSENNDIHFDIIGMDCCIMANLETCYALAPYCKYALLSEDFESGLGWSYTGWMRQFEENPGISTPLLGKYIIDDIIAANESEWLGDSSCMALFNESTIVPLFEAWKAYAYQNEDKLLDKNYSRRHTAKGRTRLGENIFWEDWGSDYSSVTLSDYYITDMLAVIENVDNTSSAAKNLLSALKACVAYYGHTSDANELTGLAVSLPYGDSEFYDQMKRVFSELGMDAEYVNWLGKFASSPGNSDFFDYEGFEDSWGGWGCYEGEYGCNVSSGGALGDYVYDYVSGASCDDGSCDYYDYGEEGSFDDWVYDYEDELWYLYEDELLYLYDDESEEMFCYDEYEDKIFYYDEDDDDWYEMDW